VGPNEMDQTRVPSLSNPTTSGPFFSYNFISINAYFLFFIFKK
jgi:hypothetical protein